MIGSHDSYSYLEAKSSAMNLITRYWRTQNKSITDQYKAGVRFFDIRVKREVDENGRTTWRTCHGSAEFSKVFTTLKSICIYFTSTLKNCYFKIWLEKGSDEDWEYFTKEIDPLIQKYKNLWQVVRKDPETIYVQRYGAKVEYYACEMEKIGNLAKGIYSYPIKEWAKEHNPKITQEMIDDPNTLYFMDYATNEF